MIKRIAGFIALVVMVASCPVAKAQVPNVGLSVDTNGLVKAPLAFWAANVTGESNALKQTIYNLSTNVAKGVVSTDIFGKVWQFDGLNFSNITKGTIGARFEDAWGATNLSRAILHLFGGFVMEDHGPGFGINDAGGGFDYLGSGGAFAVDQSTGGGIISLKGPVWLYGDSFSLIFTNRNYATAAWSINNASAPGTLLNFVNAASGTVVTFGPSGIQGGWASNTPWLGAGLIGSSGASAKWTQDGSTWTNLQSSQLIGALPAISGAALTALPNPLPNQSGNLYWVDPQFRSGTAGNMLYTNSFSTNSVLDFVIGTGGTAAIQWSQNKGDGAYGQFLLNTVHNGTPPSPAHTEMQITFPSHISMSPGTTGNGGAGHIQIGIGEDGNNRWEYFQNAQNLSAGNVLGNSMATVWRASAWYGGGEVNYMPGILGRWSTTNAPSGDYELDIFADLGNNTGVGVGNNWNDAWNVGTLHHGIQVMGGNKYATRINGGEIMERDTFTTSANSYALSFTSGFCVDITPSGTPVALTTTGISKGVTNYERRVFMLRSAGNNISYTYPTTWNTNGIALPATVNSATMLRLELEALGGPGETNISVVSAQILADNTFSWDTDALAFFTAASITDPVQKSAVNSLVLAAKSHGWWTLCDGIYPMVGGTSTSTSKDLKAAYNITWNSAGGFTFNASGVTSDGTGSGSTTFNPSSSPSPNFVRNSAHIFAYFGTSAPGANTEFCGESDGSSSSRILPNGSGSARQFNVRCNDNSDATMGESVANLQGCVLTARTGASARHWAHGATTGNDSTASTGIANGVMDIFCRSFGGSCNGTPANGYNLRGFSFGADIAAANVSQFFADWDAYNNALSRKVP